MRRSNLLFGSVLIVFAAAPAFAVTVQVPSSKDNTLYEDPNGALSNGAGTGMFAGRSSQTQNSIRRGLVSFDVASAVPAGSVITGATLTLFQSSANVDARLISPHRALESWGQGASNASAGGGGGGTAAAIGDATWLHRSFNTTLWSVAGGAYSATASASTVVSGNGFYSWSGAALAMDAQSFLDSGGTNFGWLLRGDESVSATTKRFATREEPNGSLRPVLTIEYVVPGPGVGIGTAMMAAVMSAGRRRRRERR